jgi:homogentisate phytyltransferase/homogentisate geranylgeranyltransferase
LKTLWKFSRPHTIIGSFLSISVLFLLSKNESLPTYFLVLISALFCNLYITGINQIYDVEIDRINKPNLPIASGKWTMNWAKKVVYSSLILCFLTSSILIFLWGYSGAKYTLILAVISLLGTTYSVPPIRFKRYHIWAAMAIALVRGPLVNLGIGWFFVETNQNVQFYEEFFKWILPLTVFITLFSIGIAWFKDLPDTQGDEAFGINTLAVKLSKKTAFLMGFFLVIGGFLFVLIYTWWSASVHFLDNPILFSSNIKSFILFQLLGLVAFLTASFRVKINLNNSLKVFYKIYWVLFFVMYLSYLFLLN